jgi:hypothetical protein
MHRELLCPVKKEKRKKELMDEDYPKSRAIARERAWPASTRSICSDVVS